MKYEPIVKEMCPNLIEHTVQPQGYSHWHSWAEEHFKKGWRQRKCDGCGLYAIWFKPTKGEANKTK